LKKKPIEKIDIGKGLSVTHNSGNVMTLYAEAYAGWELYLLCTADRHHDSIHCDRELEKKHLEQAKERNAFVIDVGDFFDCMQGKYDPRRSYSELRPEYKKDNYLDEIVRDASDNFFGAYADRFLMIGRGNHEASVLKNNGVDVLGNLVHRLNSDHGGHIQAGGYGGWIRILCTIGSTQRESVLIKYFHGSGGGGAVTRGVIQTNRQAVYLPDADIVLNGHTHDAWYVPIERERLTDHGMVTTDIQHHIRIPTYDNDYRDGSGGWFVETGKAPRPRGGVWLHLTCDRSHHEKNIKIEPILAIE
jgi:hypothetical protein